MSSFENPIYKAAQARKEELRKEILIRIKLGDFKEGLYPLAKNIDLTKEELEEIYKCWRMNNQEKLFYFYKESLKNHDLEQIMIADIYLANLRKTNEKGRK